MNRKKLTNEEAMELIAHETGLAAAEAAGDEPMTPEEAAEIARLDADVRAEMRAVRHMAFMRLTSQQVAAKEAGPIPARILAMGRHELIMRVDRLMARPGVSLQLGFQDLRKLTDELLRVQLMDLEAMIAKDSR